MGQMERRTQETSNQQTNGGFDRRALLRRAAVAGAVGWTAPVILTSEIASAGVFTAKCAPGTTTASASFTVVPGGCTSSSSAINITINFAGPCPCGGASVWCVRKSTPAPVAASTTASITFPVTITLGGGGTGSTAITGRVAHGCTDRDGDTQYVVQNWSMTAFDSGASCASGPNSISVVTLGARTPTLTNPCPLAASLVASPAAAPGPPGTRRTV